jgi:transcriptional regulator with XRE-family HTH domain
MSTKFRNSEEIRKAFQDLFAFKSTEEEIEHKARMIMYRFLSEVEILTDERKMTRKELAQKIGTSASFLTQLYRGSKLLNLTTIAKFEKALGITFSIKAENDTESESQINLTDKIQSYQFILATIDKKNLREGKIKHVQTQLAQEPKAKYQRKKSIKIQKQKGYEKG